MPLSSLINNLNRAVGQHDAYPFVLTPAVIGKLDFIQRIVREAGQIAVDSAGPQWSRADQPALASALSGGMRAIARILVDLLIARAMIHMSRAAD